jgi:hypothetical protein
MEYSIKILQENLDRLNSRYEKFVSNGSVEITSIIALDNRKKARDLQQAIIEINQALQLQQTGVSDCTHENTYHHLDLRSPSKTQLRKCQKGLHEFKESNYTSDKDGMLVTNKEWFCQHCGINMRNRG